MILLKILNLKRRPDRRKWVDETLFVDSDIVDLEFVESADSYSAVCDSESAIYIEHHGMKFQPMQDWGLTRDELKNLQMRWAGLGYTPADEAELELFFGRPLNTGELACFASHHAAWYTALMQWKERDKKCAGSEYEIDEDLLVVLEDDVTAVPFLADDQSVHHAFWQQV